MDHMSRSELDAIVHARLESDPEFRARLLEDPHGTLAELVGFAVPDAITVSVHEESVSDIHLVLMPDAADLSDRDLELVSGGWGFNNPQPTCGDSCGSCTL